MPSVTDTLSATYPARTAFYIALWRLMPREHWDAIGKLSHDAFMEAYRLGREDTKAIWKGVQDV